MKLSDLLTALGISFGELADGEIVSAVCSADAVVNKSVFFALKGERHDGHDFIRAALEKGAAAAIGEKQLDLKNYFRVKSSRRAFASACAELYAHPERRLRICGVTGTNGKTTVTSMVRQAAVFAGKGCGLTGTIENIAAGQHIPAERTTPPPERLYPLLRQMADGGDSLCVMEVSSHALALDRVYGLQFDVGIFTNLTVDHLDFHKTMRDYAAAKARLMENSRVSVINADDPRADFFISHAKKYVTYAIDANADFKAENVVLSSEGASFDCPLGHITLPPSGRFGIYNALAAALGALNLGIPEKSVLAGLNAFRGVRGRLEKLDAKGEYNIYIDYAHTPDGLEKVLKALRELSDGKIITVFGCGGNRDKSKRPMMGAIASRLSDFCVVTSDNPREENPSDIIDDIMTGITTYRYARVEDRKEAVRFAMLMADKGDTILLAGKGHETYQEINGQKIHMDEREIVREIENEK